MKNKTNYNPNIHHRKSIRLQGYDYSKGGRYFITICTKDRECLFGKIVNEKMILSTAGKFADECWQSIPDHFPNAILHQHTIMPNHIHGIIELQDDRVGAQNFVPSKKTISPDTGVQIFEPLLPPPDHNVPFNIHPHNIIDQRQNQFQKIIPHSIGSIVRGFKIGVTKWFHEYTDIEIVWQRNFHEHIIRNNESYNLIADYIVNNPKNWKQDKFFSS